MRAMTVFYRRIYLMKRTVVPAIILECTREINFLSEISYCVSFKLLFPNILLLFTTIFAIVLLLYTSP